MSLLKRVPILECGEPLVEFLDHPRIFLDRPRFNYRRESFVRASVAEFLHRAADALPVGFKLAIVEGWRPPHIQRRMYAASYKRFREKHPDWSERHLKRTVSRFTAPMDERVPPPHTTGGAVDLLLADESGRVLDHCSPFEPMDHRCYPFQVKGLSEEATRNRRILAEALGTGGLTNYPSEYWHWSYGDQGWAYRGRHEAALYGPITPEDWTPAPEDDTDEPLVFLLS